MTAPSPARGSAVSIALAILLALGLTGGRAGADDKVPTAWLKLDRLEVEPSVMEGLARVRLYVSAVYLEGGRIPIHGDDAWSVRVGSGTKRVPYVAGTFEGAGEELAVALVVQTSAELGDALPIIQETAGELLESLPRSTQAAVISYGENVQGGTSVGSLSRAADELASLEVEDFPEEPQLIRAVDRAVTALERARGAADGAPMRRMIIVIGDGRDYDPEPDNYRRVADRADSKGIRIHTIAYSPLDIRRPMLGLGEMSKRSHGTLRWVRTHNIPDTDDREVPDPEAQPLAFRTQLRTLIDEIAQQYVLTIFVPPDEIANRSVKVAWSDLESNAVRAPAPSCGGQECAAGAWCAAGACVQRADAGRGILGWILTIGAVLLGALVVLFVIGAVLMRQSEKRAAADALARAAQEAQAPPSHLIVPQGPQGGQVPPPQGGPVAPPQGGPVAPAAPQGGPVAPIAPQGGPVPPAGGPGAASPGPGAAAQPSLMILSGPLQGRRIPLRHGFLIGKAPGCDLVLAADGFASGQHAQVLMDTAGGCTLVDKGSTNGTFVNGVRATQMQLKHGMAIRVGGTDMRFLAQ